MKILLTGSTGMVGRNLLTNNEFIKCDLLIPQRSELDLTDYNATVDFIRTNQPDLIVHAAAKVGGIAANISEPTDFLTVNLDISKNVILAAKECLVTKLLNIGSSCIYPRNAKNPLKEECLLKGEIEPTNEGYALAKIIALKLCEYIRTEDSMFQYKTIIPCNLYGKYDSFDLNNSHLIPAIIMKIYNAKQMNCKHIDIWGDGKARREFMYAEDFADFIVKGIREFDKLPNIMNVGLGYDFSIDEYYKYTAKIIGYNGSFQYDKLKPVGMRQKLVNISKLNNFGWKSSTKIEDGIDNTYKYFLDNLN
jgi:GDP-L-fucose synthase